LEDQGGEMTMPLRWIWGK